MHKGKKFVDGGRFKALSKSLKGKVQRGAKKLAKKAAAGRSILDLHRARRRDSESEYD